MVEYGQIKQDIGQILRKLCKQKDVEIIKAQVCLDQIHIMFSTHPKYSVATNCGIPQKEKQLNNFRQTRKS